MALGVLSIDVGVDEEEYLDQTSSGKKAGIIQTFEDRFVFPCVLRDYGGVDEAKRREHVLDGNLGETMYTCMQTTMATGLLGAAIVRM